MMLTLQGIVTVDPVLTLDTLFNEASSDSRSSDHIRLRQAVVASLRSKGMTEEMIGRYIKRSQSAVCRELQGHTNDSRNNRAYQLLGAVVHDYILRHENEI